MLITLADLERVAHEGETMQLPTGQQARAMRLRAGVSATACAAAAGVSEKAWKRYESQETERFISAERDRSVGRVLFRLRNLMSETAR